MKKLLNTKLLKILVVSTLVMVAGTFCLPSTIFAESNNNQKEGSWNFFTELKDTVAELLGITVEKYNEVIEKAKEKVLDKAVKDGWLTQNQADVLRWRMEKMKERQGIGLMREGKAFSRFCMPFGKHLGGFFGRGLGFGLGPDLLSIAAEKLDMSLYELLSELDNGKSIADIAKEKNIDPKTIKDAFLKEYSEDLKDAVEDGKITQKYADRLLEEAEEKINEILEEENIPLS